MGAVLQYLCLVPWWHRVRVGACVADAGPFETGAQVFSTHGVQGLSTGYLLFLVTTLVEALPVAAVCYVRIVQGVPFPANVSACEV